MMCLIGQGHDFRRCFVANDVKCHVGKSLANKRKNVASKKEHRIGIRRMLKTADKKDIMSLVQKAWLIRGR